MSMYVATISAKISEQDEKALNLIAISEDRSVSYIMREAITKFIQSHRNRLRKRSLHRIELRNAVRAYRRMQRAKIA